MKARQKGCRFAAEVLRRLGEQQIYP